MSDQQNVVPEETIERVLALLPTHSLVEELMETGEFDSTNTIYAALHELERRGKVRGCDLFLRDIGSVPTLAANAPSDTSEPQATGQADSERE